MVSRRATDVWRYGAMLTIAVGSGVTITYLLFPPADDDRQSSALKLRVAGAIVTDRGDPVANALDSVRRYAAGKIAIRFPDGTSRSLFRSELGAEIDRARLASFVTEAARPTSAIRRAQEQRGDGGAPIDVPLPVSLEMTATVQKLSDLKAEVDAAPRSAYIDLEKRELRQEQAGYLLDVYGTLAVLEGALRQGDDAIDATVEVLPPKLTAKELGNVRFDHVLGYFETRYSSGGRSSERTYNLRLAASRLDGTVLLPGQIFDFNATVGPRDEAHGYRVAPVIAEGELVDGLGGGTCQISGTLNGAAFFAGLRRVERYPHSRPSYYIKLGLDATVVYPTINFRFQNNNDFPIVLHETVAGGTVRAEILGPERKVTVSFHRRIDEVIGFEEVERPTPTLPDGERELAQRGIPGFRTTCSRLVRDGAYAVREKWSDTYPPTTQIVHVGTGPKDEDYKAHDDPHPEYVVDQYLVVTQGPDVHTPGAVGDEPGGGMVETREPGKTGEFGWTERAGLSHFHAHGDVTQGEQSPRTDAPVTLVASPSSDDGASKGRDGEKPTKKRRRKKAVP